MINEETTKYQKIYLNIDDTLYSYLPMSFMFIFNTLIVIKLLMVKWENRLGETGSNVTLSKAATGVTIMLICTAIMFILLTLPYVIVYKSVNNVSSLAYTAALLLMYGNHSGNILIYSSANSRFKKAMKRSVLSCIGRGKVGHEETSTGSSAINTVVEKGVR